MEAVSAIQDDWEERLSVEAKAVEAQVVEIRRRLHMYPEPSGSEQETTGLLAQAFSAVGLNPRLIPTGNGLIVDGPDEVPTQRVAFRADMDALRLHDGKDAPYRSRRDGIMHACGHDAHTAMAAGAALVLHKLGQDRAFPWPVNWRGVFQPAEETAVGAEQMVVNGALDGVSSIMALHVDPSRPVGRVGFRDGAMTASCDLIRIRAVGKGGHAARPHESEDPIAAAAQLVTAIYSFIPRTVDSHSPVVVTIGKIQGGYTANVIPEQVEMEGTLRTLDQAVRTETKERLQRLVRGMSEASDVNLEISYDYGLAPVVNDPDVNAVLRAAAAGVVGIDHVEEVERPSMGGEDFSAYLERVPGAMLRLGVSPDGVEAEPLHSPLFDIDERALVQGVQILARAMVLAAQPREAG